MKLHISPQKFEELIKKSYNLDIIYLLKLIENQYDVVPLYENSMRLTAIYQSLIRKGLITKDEEKLTTVGKDLLLFVDESTTEKKFVKKKPKSTYFEEWWKEYPSTDTFKYKGKSFKGTRAIRKDKNSCKVKFDVILLEGEYTAEQLIKALKFEVMQKVTMSVKSGQNRITYMQNSLTYLNQRTYEAFMEIMEEEESEPTGSTDI
jgi:hypothetical protein